MRPLVTAMLMVFVATTALAQSKPAKQDKAPKKPDSTAAALAAKNALPKGSMAGDAGPWVGSTTGHTFYQAGCDGSKKMNKANVVSWKTEADAKTAGYKRSTSKGC